MLFLSTATTTRDRKTLTQRVKARISVWPSSRNENSGIVDCMTFFSLYLYHYYESIIILCDFIANRRNKLYYDAVVFTDQTLKIQQLNLLLNESHKIPFLIVAMNRNPIYRNHEILLNFMLLSLSLSFSIVKIQCETYNGFLSAIIFPTFVPFDNNVTINENRWMCEQIDEQREGERKILAPEKSILQWNLRCHSNIVLHSMESKGKRLQLNWAIDVHTIAYVMRIFQFNSVTWFHFRLAVQIGFSILYSWIR